ncbi:hypothetical protein PSTG_08289 [Puccinia striiformis f. sp. tritici PST-78]|uniref:Uncharacterized protein n=1 Tax=Puccinia striiformis f. sp. tritici PST-78 TaxID=1165861 RepID=A0A0L0VH91_9BASI|nr:hypothetical protein PSTG_08289 [Puccinia striiformis f. sp. tritici PST-78]
MVHTMRFTTFGRGLLLFLVCSYLAYLPMGNSIPMDTSAALGKLAEKLPRDEPEVRVTGSWGAFGERDIDNPALDRAHHIPVSSSPLSRPTVSDETKRRRPVKGSQAEDVRDDSLVEDSPTSVPKNVQELSAEWQEELRAGLSLISTSRHSITAKIQDQKLFEGIPRYLNVLVGQQLEKVLELNGLAESDETSIGNSLTDLLHNPRQLLDLIKSFSSRPNQLSSFLGDHVTSEELEHFEQQIQKIVRVTNKRLFRMIAQLDQKSLKEIVENSKTVTNELGDNLAATLHESYANQVKDASGEVEKSGPVNQHLEHSTTSNKRQGKLMEDQPRFAYEQQQHLEEDIETILHNKLTFVTTEAEAKGVYSLVRMISQVTIQHEIRAAIQQQTDLDSIFDGLLGLYDPIAPPQMIYEKVKGFIQFASKKYITIPGLHDQEQEAASRTVEKPRNPLRLSTLWNARSSADLGQFGSDVQMFQNLIHRHLLDLFKEYRYPSRSHSPSFDYWIRMSKELTELAEISDPHSKFGTSFIDQLQEAEKSFKQWWPNSKIGN